MLTLIKEESIDIKTILEKVENDSKGTKWSETSKKWTKDYIKHLHEVYGDNWYFGYLKESDFKKILLPRHGSHSDSGHHEKVLFELDTNIIDAGDIFLKNTDYDILCSENIKYLVEQISSQGFISNITLAVINGSLKHVDGLHRLIAYQILLKDGLKYEPIPVYLCRKTNT